MSNQVHNRPIQRAWSSLLGKAPSGAVLKGDPSSIPVSVNTSLPTRPNQVKDGYSSGAPVAGLNHLLNGRSYTNRN